MRAAEKSLLRSQFKPLFCRPRSDRFEGSHALCALIAKRPEFQAAARVGIFLGREWEPDLISLWKRHPQKCVFPRVDDDTMRFFSLEREADLHKGFGGIFEPPPEIPVPFGPGDLVLVPGLAFDRSGGRLGSGKGFYDRFLAGKERLIPWGVCFDDQIVEVPIPMESHDIFMLATVTPAGVTIIHND